MPYKKDFNSGKPPRKSDKPFKKSSDGNDRPRRDNPTEFREKKRYENPLDKDELAPPRFLERPPSRDRNFNDRPKREFGTDRPRGDKPFNADRPYKKEGGFNDRPKREYGTDRPRGDKPFNADRPYKKEGGFNERPKREYGTDRPRGDKPFNADRPYKKEGGYDDRPKREYGTDRPHPRDANERKQYKPKYDPEIKNKPSFRDRTDKTFGERKKELLGTIDDNESIRLNKYVANSGICSRREADELIGKGLVTVNGTVVKEMGHKVAKTDTVMYEGRKILPEPYVYVIMNKPKDFLTTTDDDQGRKTVMDLIADKIQQRIFPVGRLDRNTTGVLLLTNDGEVTQALTHPSFEIKKVYHVELDKKAVESDLDKLVTGITLEDGEVHADAAAFVETEDKRHVGIEIHNGRNRIVRRMFEHLGYEVEKLDRVSFGIFTKKDLPRGKWRHLSPSEVGFLMKLKAKM